LSSEQLLARSSEARSLFVEILFALVVAELFGPLRHLHRLSLAAGVHIALTLIVVLLSWTAHHRSTARSASPPIVFSPPLFQLAIEIGIVATYFVCASAVEGQSLSVTTSALPEAVCIGVAFGLYLAWDLNAFYANTRWKGRPVTWSVAERAIRRRRTRSTLQFAIVSAALVVPAVYVGSSTYGVIAVDLALLTVVLLYRWRRDRRLERA
jgi:hypothetical protein